MYLQRLRVSSIFAVQTTKQSKQMTVKPCTFKVGRVYLFHADNPRCSQAESLCGWSISVLQALDQLRITRLYGRQHLLGNE